MLWIYIQSVCVSVSQKTNHHQWKGEVQRFHGRYWNLFAVYKPIFISKMGNRVCEHHEWQYQMNNRSDDDEIIVENPIFRWCACTVTSIDLHEKATVLSNTVDYYYCRCATINKRKQHLFNYSVACAGCTYTPRLLICVNTVSNFNHQA